MAKGIRVVVLRLKQQSLLLCEIEKFRLAVRGKHRLASKSHLRGEEQLGEVVRKKKETERRKRGSLWGRRGVQLMAAAMDKGLCIYRVDGHN